MRVFRSAFIYAVLTFAAGFLLGTIRVLLLAPRLGETVAVLLELPIMLGVSFLVARWAVARWKVPENIGARVAMGAIAFAVLMTFEALVSVTLFDNRLSDHLARYLQPQAWPGLAAQLFFAAMPVVLLLRFMRR